MATWEVGLGAAEAVVEEDMAGVMMMGRGMEAAAATWAEEVVEVVGEGRCV